VQLETMYSEIEGPVATLVLNRPEVLNCANEQWARDLNTLIDGVMADKGVRVVVLRGSGRAFCSGIDLTALSRGEISMDFFRNWEGGLRKLETMDPIAVAAVQSHCIGGGLQITLACDLRIARDDAQFGITAVREGIIPGIGMWRIARYAGMGRAKQLALIADKVDAATALQWGLVDWVESAETFETRVEEVVARILTMAWTSTRLTKKLTNAAFDLPFQAFVDTYLDYQAQSTASPEHQAAMAEHRAHRAERASGKGER
jgi:enoyl-CoA hydratase/carnithine racemase